MGPHYVETRLSDIYKKRFNLKITIFFFLDKKKFQYLYLVLVLRAAGKGGGVREAGFRQPGTHEPHRGVRYEDFGLEGPLPTARRVVPCELYSIACSETIVF